MEERVRCWSSGPVTSALVGLPHVVIASFLTPSFLSLSEFPQASLLTHFPISLLSSP